MSNNPGEVIILDGANIKGAGIIGKLDALVREGRKFLIPQFILDEMGPGPAATRFGDWIEAQRAAGRVSDLADGFQFDINSISLADAARYGTDPGDAGIKKYLTEAAPRDVTFSVFTDDGHCYSGVEQCGQGYIAACDK